MRAAERVEQQRRLVNLDAARVDIEHVRGKRWDFDSNATHAAYRS